MKPRAPSSSKRSARAVTDENGAYRIVDLRPGTYTLTFTLPGFNTFKREGARAAVELHRDDQRRALKVGALQESVTVSGASPVVDVQTNVKRRC